MSTMRTLGLAKDGEFFILRYHAGLEDRVVEEVMRQADDPSHPFDWTDAATMSFAVTNSAAAEAIDTLPAE